MDGSKVPPRPRQVTMAAVLGVVASVLLVLSLFDTLTRLRSIEMRTAIEEFLAQEPGRGLGLDTEAVTELLRGLVFVNGALAAVAGVLAVYVAQRHQASRIGFTVAAGLLLLTSPVTGGALALLVAFAAMLLWGRPARDWFAGRSPEPAVADRSGRDGRPARDGIRQEPWPPPRQPGPEQWPPPSGHLPAPTGGPVDQPAAPGEAGGPGPSDPRGGDSDEGAGDGERRRPAPAAHPFGQRPAAASAASAAEVAPQPPAPGPPSWPAPAEAARRPGTVVGAAVLTFVSAGLVLLLFGTMVTGMLLAKDAVLDAIEGAPELSGSDLSPRDLLAVLWVVSALSLFWCLAAIALGVLVLKRVRWARATLVVSAAVSALFGILGFPFGLLISAAAAVTVWLLLRPATSAWFASAAPGPRGPSGPPGPPSAPWGGQGPDAPRPPYADPGRPPQEQQPVGRPNGKPPVW